MSNTIITIILFVLMLSVITLVHEFGHLITAKKFGVYCKEFAIGMGPKICGKKYNETEYSIRALPIGGFVSMVGENDIEDPDIEKLNIPKERTLKGIAKWKQMIVMFAGIFMNFVLALLIYSILMLYIGSYTVTSKPVIESIKEDMPAYNSGLKIGDVVVKAETSGYSIEPDNYSELTTFLASYYDGNGSWILTVDRDGQLLEFEIVPSYYEQESRYIIGITFSNVATKTVDINILNCFKYGFIYMSQMVKMVFVSLIGLFKGVGLNNLSGPIGVYEVVEQTISYGFDYYIELLALISINAAIFNAIPIPAFDGGRAFILLIESIIGRNLPRKFETAILAASWVLIIMLIVFVSLNDINKIIGG